MVDKIWGETESPITTELEMMTPINSDFHVASIAVDLLPSTIIKSGRCDLAGVVEFSVSVTNETDS